MTAQHAPVLNLRAMSTEPARLSTDCLVTACRGCCCGTVEKHPDVDHAGQLDALDEGLAGRARVRTTGCLNSCDYSNVVVVQPSAWGRALGGRPTWFQRILTPELTQAIVAWVRAGGPGVAEMPQALGAHLLTAARLRRGQDQPG